MALHTLEQSEQRKAIQESQTRQCSSEEQADALTGPGMELLQFNETQVSQVNALHFGLVNQQQNLNP